MEHVDYPPFLFPEPCRGKDTREWTRKEARLYYNWFMEHMDERIAGLLSYFQETFDGTPEDVLERLGNKVAGAIMQPEHHRMDPLDPEMKGSVVSMCMDLGMLVGQYLVANSRLEWTLHGGGKLDINRNQPVLVGFNWDPRYPMNPCSISYHLAHAILRGEEDGSLWRKIYSENLSSAESPVVPRKSSSG